jgi:hypothetical protein
MDTDLDAVTYEASADDVRIVAALRDGDERVFVELVNADDSAPVRLAKAIVLPSGDQAGAASSVCAVPAPATDATASPRAARQPRARACRIGSRVVDMERRAGLRAAW